MNRRKNCSPRSTKKNNVSRKKNKSAAKLNKNVRSEKMSAWPKRKNVNA